MIFELHSEIVIKRDWRFIWGSGNRASLEIHLEAGIEQVWRYALRGHDCANWEVVIEQVWRFTFRPLLREIGRGLGGGRWTVLPVRRPYSSVSPFSTLGM